MEEVKLYKVSLRGMQTNSTGTAHGISYVVAGNSEEAYQKVKRYLDDNKIGFSRERELESVELIADTNPYTNVGTLLYL